MSASPKVATRVFLASVLFIVPAIRASAQTTPGPSSTSHTHLVSPALELGPEVSRLLATTKQASAEFQNRRAAIAAGYRRIGPDVPSMGEHWINPRVVVADSFDIARPALLTYIEVGGVPVLTGVVYAVALTAGQSPPPIFGSAGLWHEHNGTLDEEALLPDHHTLPSAATGTRLAILHAWLWSPNPLGMFATDNWTIPFLRLGLAPPQEFPEGAARALSLISGAEDHYLNVAGAAAGPAISALLVDCRNAAKKIVDGAVTRGRALDKNEVEALNRAWSNAMAAVSKVAGPGVASRLNGGRMP